MVLSEADAEVQLAVLRRQRDALDRTIADLTLYLELGRRLRGGDGDGADASRAASGMPVAAAMPAGSETASPQHPADHAGIHAGGGPGAPRRIDPTVTSAATPASDSLRHDPGEGILSEGVLARRYGRALIEAALSALDEAGRPLHASEILALLSARGFTLPGHDPVAALNTRLWKRSGPGGPLKRMGDAVYALAEEGE